MQTLPFTSSRDKICLVCREKTCCSYYTVTVRGPDLARIARAMQLAPADFLTYHAVAEGEEGFLLHPDGPPHVLTLAKRPLPGQTGSPCIFLLRTNADHGLCGLGDLRPGQCHTFPSYLADGFVAVAHAPAGCVRTWSYGDIDLDEERRKLMRLQTEDAVHDVLVEEWNTRVRADRRERSTEEFCTFLLNRLLEQEDAA